MRINNAGLELIKRFEGLRLTAYQCSAGVWTIGYGHTAGVKKGDRITEEKALEYLYSDLKSAENKVNAIDALGGYHFNENEYSALVSFCFNVGNVKQLTGNGKKTRDKIRTDILLYKKATVNGKKVTLKGLEERRKAELKLFNTPCVTTFDEIVNLVISGKLGNGAERKKNVESYGYSYTDVQKEVNKRLQKKNVSRETFDDVVKMVISGKLGNGLERKKNVESYGYSYADVQREVNKRMGK